MDHADAKEYLGKHLLDLGGEPPEDLKTAVDPNPLLPERTRDRMRAQQVDLVQVAESFELLPEGRAALRVIETQALKLRADPVPGPHEHPGCPRAQSTESEEAFQAIDEQ